MLNHCMLHPEPAAGVSGMAQAHGLQVEDLEEVIGHQAPAAQATFGSATTVLALFYPSSFSIDLGDSYCNIIAMTYSTYSSDDIQWQGYIAINIIQFNSLAILT